MTSERRTRCKQGQCRLRMFCRSTPQARQIASVHLGEKPLAMQTTCGSDYCRVGSLMNLDPLLIAGKIKADQRVQLIYQIRRIRHRNPLSIGTARPKLILQRCPGSDRQPQSAGISADRTPARRRFDSAPGCQSANGPPLGGAYSFPGAPMRLTGALEVLF